MKKVKKLLSALVCMAMLCAVLPCVTVGAATSGTCGDNLTWTLDSDGVLLIVSPVYALSSCIDDSAPAATDCVDDLPAAISALFVCLRNLSASGYYRRIL